MVRLLGQPLRRTAIASLHEADKDNSEMRYCPTDAFRSRRSSRPTMAFGEGAGTAQARQRHASDEWGARKAA
jgi:hypothetical protein